MPYVVVDNFSGGLDSRRHVLNSKTGTLAVLKNAHITRGGEIEKRKAFVQLTDLTDIGVQTFGLEATADGIYVFGSEAPPATMPDGIIYQRLAHPASDTSFGGLNPSNYYFEMTKVVFSTVYGGKPFVIAEFTGGSPLAYGLHRVAFYDGVPIKDWYEGMLFYELDVHETIQMLESYFPEGGYTATTGNASDEAFETSLMVTGPAGKAFTISGFITAPNTVEVTTTQTHKEAIPETLSKGSFSITGGSTTAANASRGGRYIDAAGLPGIRSIRIGASSATANNGLDLIGWGGATGLKYNTYAVTDPYGSDAGALLWNIRKAINDNTSAGLAHGYSARWASYGGWSGPDPAAVWIDAPSALGSGANGLLVQIEFDSNPHNISGISELVDPATIAVSPYDNQRHIATFGVLADGSFNRINSVKVDGVEVLGSPVSWETSHGATASAVATQINSYTSSTEYTASVEDSSKVVLTGSAGSGKTPNGRVISVETEGTIVVSGITSFSGGVNGIAAVPQISRVKFVQDPTLSALPIGTKFSVTIIDPDRPTQPYVIGASRVVGKSPSFSITYKSKEYIGSGSTLYFSAVNDATKWDIYDTGSGFIDMSNNFGGREDLTGAGIYQDRLAVFSRRNVQLWAMDADPAQNAQVQILANTGCLAPDSVVSVGSIDTLYLADNGIRSLRARENTDTAFSSDIGSAIDSIVIKQMEALEDTWSVENAVDAEATKYFAKAVIEPIDGRYWLALGRKIYVLSYFPGSNISAWSVYEDDQWLESLSHIKEMVAREDKVYVRDSQGKIYIYGFEYSDVYGKFTSNIYDDCEVVVELPYLDGNKPATYKEAKGIDVTCEGEWKVYLGFDHTNPTARDLVATVNQSTFALGKIPATGAGTHFGPRFVHQAQGPALLANFIVHFDEMHSKHDAG